MENLLNGEIYSIKYNVGDRGFSYYVGQIIHKLPTEEGVLRDVPISGIVRDPANQDSTGKPTYVIFIDVDGDTIKWKALEGIDVDINFKIER